jgi:very-short-patch-repair endonuclease
VAVALDARGEDPTPPRRQRLHRLRARVPLEWNGNTYRYDFAFADRKVILEANGKRWHNDPVDFEPNQEKWSVPGRHGWRIVFSTWRKVVRTPDALLDELTATLSA